MMTAGGYRTAWLFVWLVGIVNSMSAWAVLTVDVPGSGSTPARFTIDASAPSPKFPDLTFYTLDLNTFFASAYPGQTSGNVLPQSTFAENELTFHLAMIGLNPIVASQTFRFDVTGNYWSVQVKLDFAAASSPIFDSDVLTLSGQAVHRVGPHPGEVAPGDAVPYRVELHGGRSLTLTEAGVPVTSEVLKDALGKLEIPSGGRYGLDTNAKVHPRGQHTDATLGVLFGKVATPNVPFVSNEIEYWGGGISAAHSVPAPVAGLCLAAGLALLGAFRSVYGSG